MLAVMFWGDDEQQKKTRVEQTLRKKREERGTGRLKPPALPDNTSREDPGTAEELFRQTELINEQQSEIRDLKHLLIQHGKVLEKILEKQDGPQYEILNQPTAKELRESGGDLPSLQELNVNVINTEGIETRGEVGENRKEGTSIKDRVSRLRALKRGA
jgi:hypothetical protein